MTVAGGVPAASASPIGRDGGKVAFVLAGGASHGAVQVGMLEALMSRGVVPDLVVGASIGALNAAAFASDPTLAGLEHLAAEWRKARRSQVFPLWPPGLLLGAIGRRDHLISNRGLATLIENVVTFDRLEAALLPVHVVATDLATGNPVVLSEGRALPALLASTAIPGVFPPVDIEGQFLIDGGVSADTPVLEAEALGATTIYVLPTYATGSAAVDRHSAVWMGWSAIEQLLKSCRLEHHRSRTPGHRPGHPVATHQWRKSV